MEDDEILKEAKKIQDRGEKLCNLLKKTLEDNNVPPGTESIAIIVYFVINCAYQQGIELSVLFDLLSNAIQHSGYQTAARDMAFLELYPTPKSIN